MSNTGNNTPNGSTDDNTDSTQTITFSDGLMVSVEEVTDILRQDRESETRLFRFRERKALMHFRNMLKADRNFSAGQIKYFSDLVRRVIEGSSVDEQKETARGILEQYEGYLSPYPRQLCQDVADGKQVFRKSPDGIIKRAEDMIQAGIPPIFCKEFEAEDENPFPNVDFLLQFISGKYRKNQRSQIIRAKKSGAKKSPFVKITPSLNEDVTAFRTLAFDGDKISPQVYREINAFAKSHFRIEEGQKELVSRSDLLILKYLERALLELKPEERECDEYTEGDDLSFLKKELWHLRYTPEDRLNITNDYKRRLEGGERALTSNKKLFQNMQMLFPDVFPDEEILERARVEAKLVECRQLDDYRGMPLIVLVDPRFGTKYIEEVQDHLRKILDEISRSDDPFRLLNNIYDCLLGHLKIPYAFLALHEFRDLVTRARLSLLENMNDDDFRSNIGRFQAMSLGHRQKMVYNLADIQLREVLVERAKNLGIL